MDDLDLARAAADAPDRAALIEGGVTYTFADLASRAASACESLSAAGVTAGSRVALIAKNSVETVVVIHALIALGATIVPIHPRLTEREIEVVLADARPALVLREGDLRTAGEDRNTSLSPAERLRAVASRSPAEAPLAIVYTSGTTGKPKGAVLSRRAFIAGAEGSAANLGWIDDDRWICVMPLCHVGGLSILTRCLIARRAVILLPRFDPGAVIDAVARHRATILSVVPTMLRDLLDRDAEGALARLRAVLTGGAAAPFSLIEQAAARGVPVITTYGLTEACSQVTVQRVSPVARRGSGEPLAGVDLRVARDDGSTANQGEVGRILVRGPTLMDGYFRGPDRSPDPRTDAAGFFDTGDLGALDEGGAIHVHARRNDLVVTGGENVYPLEVEQRLEAVPGVRRALVFGVPDDRWGQIVAAAIEADAGVDPEAIVLRAAEDLAPHKRPRLVCVVSSLPLTGSGKLDRSRVIDRFGAALRPVARAR